MARLTCVTLTKREEMPYLAAGHQPGVDVVATAEPTPFGRNIAASACREYAAIVSHLSSNAILHSHLAGTTE
jgi:hypothetical protein